MNKRTLFTRAGYALVTATLLILPGCDEDSNIVGPGPDPMQQFSQIDRIGIPAVATVFIPTAQKDPYNQAAPSGDRAQYKDEIVNGLVAFGNDAGAADALGNALTPDVLTLDLGQASGFLNGRTLSDDVITAELGLIFGANADLNDDNVDANDRAFLNTFPYLAAPWTS